MKSSSEHCMASAHNCGLVLLWISAHSPVLSKGIRRENELVGSLFQEFSFLGGKVKISPRGQKTPTFVRGRVEFSI